MTRKVCYALLTAVLFLSSCQPTSAPNAPQGTPGSQPYKINGSFSYTNDFVVETYMVEQAVALADMTGFVKRDRHYLTSTESQTLGFMQPDYENNRATFWIQLPIRPEGELNQVDPSGRSDKGVQIFAVAYWPNLTGGPYSEGDDPSFGWPSYLASVQTDTENQDEVIGGKLLIWSPDARQQFPSGFGADGKLFTADDPVAGVPSGYTVVDLDQQPFKFSWEAEPEFTLLEPKDVAIKDFSQGSYSEAFQKMFDIVRKEYAFNGIPGKAPDWQALYDQVQPKVKAAEAAGDPQAYYLALREFTWAFQDGHVGLSGGEVENQVFSQAVSAGYGFAVRTLDDGRVMVSFVTAGGPAAKAGIQVGDVLTSVDGLPVEEALARVQPLSAPFSTEFARRYQQERYLLRAKAGVVTPFILTGRDGSGKQVSLTAVPERESYAVTSTYYGQDPNALPVEFRILDSGVGYVKINSNYDDLNLIVRLFSRALKTFSDNQVPGIVIDLRQNRGGSPLGLAGFLYDQEIALGQLEYYSDKTGKFEPEGVPERVVPNQEQYRFDRMALLVGQACASACEIEAYGFSQVPGMRVFGVTPSAGVEAEVGRGQFSLPDGISLQVPTGRFTLPDGSIFLEGQGVPLTDRVPVSEENLLSGRDAILDAAVQAVLLPLGAGIQPAGDPELGSAAQVQEFLASGNPQLLEDVSDEGYPAALEPGRSYTYQVRLPKSQPLLWGFLWCAKDQATLDGNFADMAFTFTLNGRPADPARMQSLDFSSQGLACRLKGYEVASWPAGAHHLETVVKFEQAIDDGSQSYAAGEITSVYTVYVKP